MIKKYAVIVAGGSGKRFGSEIPKQFLLVNNEPILMHTIRKFHLSNCNIILVLPEVQIAYWKDLCESYSFNINHAIVPGGKERFHSVKNGIDSINEEGVVAVHDGVRPLLSAEMIDEGFRLAEQKGVAIPFVDVRDSMRKVVGDKMIRVDRSEFKLIQTPQVFDVKRLKDLMDCEYQDSFTDEATLWEEKGGELFYYQGEHQNLKITYPADLIYAEAVLKQ